MFHDETEPARIILSVIGLECEQKCFILYSSFWGLEDEQGKFYHNLEYGGTWYSAQKLLWKTMNAPFISI